MDETLFQACRAFVDEQGAGEWTDNLIDSDARKLVEFIDKVRPSRPKLNLDVEPGIISLLDGSETREADARWAADQGIRMTIAELDAGGVQHAPADLVRLALDLLTEARKQVAVLST